MGRQDRASGSLLSNRSAALPGLFLGWKESSHRGLGFPTPAETDRGASPQCQPEAVFYEGDSHLITIAPTGAGKGRGVIIPVLLTHPGPVVVFDPKGEAYHVTHRRRRELGQRVIKLDPFGVVEDKPSDRLNPLDIFRLPGADLETDAQMLAEQMSLGIRSTKEPFWDIAGTALNSGLISCVASTRKESQQHLGSVLEMLMSGDCAFTVAQAVDEYGERMSGMARAELSHFAQLPEMTRGGVLATATSYLKALGSQRVLRTIESSSFQLDEVTRGEALSIYLVIPPDKLASHRNLYKIWVATLLKAVTCRRVIPEQRTLFLLDEAGQLDDFPLLETMSTLFRGMGLQIWTFWQDASQIRHLFPTSHETLLNNAGVVQTFGIANFGSAQRWAQLMNRPPEELVELDPSQQMIFVQGRGVVKCRRGDYLKDPDLAGTYDPNPFFAKLPSVPDATKPAARSGRRTTGRRPPPLPGR